jgi:hypothetical protein
VGILLNVSRPRGSLEAASTVREGGSSLSVAKQIQNRRNGLLARAPMEGGLA